MRLTYLSNGHWYTTKTTSLCILPRRHLYIKTVPASLLWPYAILCLPFHLDNIVPLSKRYITFTLVLCSDASWLSVIPLQRLYHTLSISATATTGGNAGGASCVFPFTYNGVSYTTCIIAYNGNTSWCATTNNYPSDQRWGNCRKSHMRSALKTESCCDTNLIVNGSTGGSRDDPRCHQWRQSWNHDDSRFSVGTLDRSRSFYLKKCYAYYNNVIMSAMASQITGVPIVYSIVCSGTDQRKHQSSASLAFVRGIHRWPVNSPHKGPVTRKMFPFGDVIMSSRIWASYRQFDPTNEGCCARNRYQGQGQVITCHIYCGV